MSVNGWFQILFYFIVLLLLTRPVGVYLYLVFEGERQPLPRSLGLLERGTLRLCGIDPRAPGQHSWQEYTGALLLFSAFGMLVTYGIQRLQHVLPLNPRHLGPVAPDLAFNTAASFTTNTNWQSYAGESTMSYLTQMAGLAWHNFISAATGIGVALAIARGITRRPGPEGSQTLGNFWVDVVRGLVYVLLPASLVIALIFVAQGMIQTFAPYQDIVTLDGAKQTLALGPVASQEVIKMLGTNGGGFFNANSAHPFENPTPLTNMIQMLLILIIPAGLTYTYGRMARDQKEGWVLFGAMSLLFFVGVTTVYAAETSHNAAVTAALHTPQIVAASGRAPYQPYQIDQTPGNLEGKEVRFGVADSALFATVTTDASCGAVNSMHDSLTWGRPRRSCGTAWPGICFACTRRTRRRPGRFRSNS